MRVLSVLLPFARGGELGHGAGKNYEVQVPCGKGRPREKEPDGRAKAGGSPQLITSNREVGLRGRVSGCGGRGSGCGPG